VGELMKSGRPQKQALAIAYREQGEKREPGAGKESASEEGNEHYKPTHNTPAGVSQKRVSHPHHGKVG
jgi:hypothetical protein